MKTLTKFTIGRNNFDVILGSPRSVLNKEGISYLKQDNQLKSESFLTWINHNPLHVFIVVSLVKHLNMLF